MLTKNITKKLLFVTVFSAILLIFANCGLVSSNNLSSSRQTAKEYSTPKIVGKIKSDEINESSGLVNSRCNPEVFWTHNDSGDKEFIYALNEEGARLGTWKVSGATNKDWEDIATFKDKSGKCFLYLADIGNNELKKDILTIYKVGEPQINENDKDSSKQNPLQTEPAEEIKFSYPNGNHNAETLLVHPITGDIYVLTKHQSEPSEVFKIGANTEKITDFTVPSVPYGFLTGGEISPDGKRIIICDYAAAYEIKLPDNAKTFDEIWKQTPAAIDLGDREQGESICYSADGKRIYAGSEKKNSPIIMVEHK